MEYISKKVAAYGQFVLVCIMIYLYNFEMIKSPKRLGKTIEIYSPVKSVKSERFIF